MNNYKMSLSTEHVKTEAVYRDHDIEIDEFYSRNPERNSDDITEETFDAWLNAIRAQAYDRGVHEREEIPYWEDGPDNPYLEQA